MYHRNTHWTEISKGRAQARADYVRIARHCLSATFPNITPGNCVLILITASSFYSQETVMYSLPKLMMGVSFEPCYTHRSIGPDSGVYKGVAAHYSWSVHFARRILSWTILAVLFWKCFYWISVNPYSSKNRSGQEEDSTGPTVICHIPT